MGECKIIFENGSKLAKFIHYPFSFVHSFSFSVDFFKIFFFLTFNNVTMMCRGRVLWYFFRCSVAKSCPTICDPMDCSILGLPFLYCLLEFAQTHVHWVGDVIQPFCSLLPLSLFVLNLSRHQGLFQWVISGGQSIGVSGSATVLTICNLLSLFLSQCFSQIWKFLYIIFQI